MLLGLFVSSHALAVIANGVVVGVVVIVVAVLGICRLRAGIEVDVLNEGAAT